MLAKLWTIIKSRFKKETGEAWITARREVCLQCPLHLNDTSERTLKQKAYKWLADFYTWLTRSENEELGQCSICGCTTYHMTRQEEIECSSKEEYGIDYWKSIYIPNSSDTKNGKTI